ncbi:MAG TPA: hypothetical protein VGI39_06185, partial [Polyangiaceae bacterium]
MKNLRLTLALSSLLAAVGCSGAAPQVVEQAPADTNGSSASQPTGGSSASNGGSSTGSSGAGSGSTNSGGSTSGGASSPPSNEDAGSPPDPSSGGGGFDAGTAPDHCPQGATHQANWGGGSEHSATSFDGTACGMLGPGRTYWWTFMLPASASNLGVVFSGN